MKKHKTTIQSNKQKTFVKFKISACKKLKTGHFERRHSSSFTKMTAWIRRNDFTSIDIKCSYAHGFNEGTYDNPAEALWFIHENWKDYQSLNGGKND
jgi:hypothetical protein